MNVIIAVCYLYFSGIGEKLSNPAVTTLVIYVASFFAFTLAVFLHTRLRSGYYAVRRLLAMMGDFGSLTYVMLLGQTLALPLYVFIVWVTLGNGMRFGSRYLIIASAMAQLSLLALYILGDFWR